MTISSSSSTADADHDRPFSSPWRMARAREQEAALPSGAVLVSCSAPAGTGGLGRHASEISEALGRRDSQAPIVAGGGLSAGGHDGRGRPLIGAVRRLSRFSPAWRSWADCVAFDRYAARRLVAAEHLIAFNGEADAQFGAARKAGFQSVSLMAANSHLKRVMRQHALAYERHPLERSWAGHLLARNLREYESADCVYYTSEYTRESFIEQGFPEERLTRFPLTPDTRFQPTEQAPE